MSATCRIAAQTGLSDAERQAMLDLHRRHFDNVDGARFGADLAEKDWVIVLSRCVSCMRRPAPPRRIANTWPRAAGAKAR